MQPDRTVDIQSRDRFSLLLDGGDGDSGVTRLIVSGEVDGVSADRLTETVADVLSGRGPQHVEIDLGGVTFLDSAGIRALVRCHADAERAECRLTLTAPQVMVYRVLEITGLLEHFGLTESRPPGGSRREWPAPDRSPLQVPPLQPSVDERTPP